MTLSEEDIDLFAREVRNTKEYIKALEQKLDGLVGETNAHIRASTQEHSTEPPLSA